jgi:hypothetical protein
MKAKEMFFNLGRQIKNTLLSHINCLHKNTDYLLNRLKEANWKRELLKYFFLYLFTVIASFIFIHVFFTFGKAPALIVFFFSLVFIIYLVFFTDHFGLKIKYRLDLFAISHSVITLFRKN